MTEPTLTQLKIIVERVVRPVHASTARKRKMREELLAHVSGVFAEESATLGDGPAALARTQERFGPAAELTAQLQASVPRSDYFGRVVEDLVFGSGESTLRRATRNAARMSLLFGAALLPAFVVQHRLGEWPIIPGVAAMAFCFTVMNHWMRGALYGASGRSWLRAMLVGLASSMLIPGVTFGVCATITGDPWSSLIDILQPDRLGILLLPWALMLTWLPIGVAAYAIEQELRYRREWDNLQIG